MPTQIAQRAYAVPFDTSALMHAASVIDKVRSEGHTAAIVAVTSAWCWSHQIIAAHGQHSVREYLVTVRGDEYAHGAMLDNYPWQLDKDPAPSMNRDTPAFPV